MEITYEEYEELKSDCYEKMTFEEWCSSSSLYYKDETETEYVKVKDENAVDIVYNINSIQDDTVHLERA